MTSAEIRSYELVYQIRHYLSSHHKSKEQFCRMAGVPLTDFTQFLQHGEPELPVSWITKICDVLSITLDSLVHGPIKEFLRLMRKCAFAEKLEGTCFYIPYFHYLKRWRERNIKPACLKRYTQWFMYYCSMSEESSTKKAAPFPSQLSSSVCFTRKISSKQKEKLEQMIEDSKKK